MCLLKLIYTAETAGMRQNKEAVMKVIGLTGGTGSGKGMVSAFLSEKGLYIIDADKIAHKIILKGEKAYDELVEYFGEEILDENGEIIRRKLGTIVFADGKEKLEFLNKCTHKHIYEKIEEEINFAKKENKKAAIIDAPLLIEGDFINLCQMVWVVYADENVRIKRIMARDLITEKQAKDRISNQKSWEVYKSFANEIIDNSGDFEKTKQQLEKLLVSVLGE